jgi:hypothetical protein
VSKTYGFTSLKCYAWKRLKSVYNRFLKSRNKKIIFKIKNMNNTDSPTLASSFEDDIRLTLE